MRLWHRHGISPSPLSVHLILIAGSLCFASLPVVGRLVVGDIPPGGIVMVRMTGGAIAFGLYAWRRGTLKLDRRDLPLIVACALMGNVINQEMFVHALAHTTATNAVVIGSTIPVFTLIGALVLGRERVRPHRVLGIALAFTGVAVLVGADDVSLSSSHVAGTVMVLINAVSYGLFLVIVKPLAQKYDPIALLAIMFAIGLPISIPIGIFEFTGAPPLGAQDLGFLAFLIAVPTVGAYSLTQIALRRADSSLVAAYIYLQPVAAAIGAVIVLDETITARLAACGVVVLFGVWLAARSGNPAPRPPGQNICVRR
jgi:drug/metabolite transporter (DMT)-like permease